MNSRIKSLDGLRGILCILVVFHHYDAKYIPPYFFENFIIRQADLLVDFFFIISGFVISYNYKHIGRIEEAKLFLKKRFFRLYPLLLYTTTLYFIFEIVSRNAFSSFINKEINNTTIIKSYLDTLFLNNSTPLLGSSWGINRPTWSISAEFYAYILYAIILLISRNKTRKIFFWMVLLVSAALLFWLSRIGNYNNAEYGFLRCIYLFMTGAFIDVLKFRTSKFKLYIDLMLLATTISLLYFNKYNVSSSFTHLVLELGVMPLLFVCIIYRSISDDGFLTKIFSTTPLQWLGKYSYSIYLNHALILLAFPKFIFQVAKLDSTPVNEYIVFGCCIALSLVYSRFTYKFIEQKFYLNKNH